MVDINRTVGQIFNIGANNQTSIIGLADTIRRMTGSDSPTLHIPFNEVYGTGIEDMLHRVPCIDKVRDDDRLGAERTSRTSCRRDRRRARGDLVAA